MKFEVMECISLSFLKCIYSFLFNGKGGDKQERLENNAQPHTLQAGVYKLAGTVATQTAKLGLVR